jgi:hypothetical protein
MSTTMDQDEPILRDGRIEAEIALERVAATASLRAPYDPANERIRA